MESENGILREPIVITGIGIVASVGTSRESVWEAVRRGKSGVRHVDPARSDLGGLKIAATVDLDPPLDGRLKAIVLNERAASEAIEDARVDFDRLNRRRFACAISGHMGDTGFFHELIRGARRDEHSVPWFHQWLPNTACCLIANKYGLEGPRLSHSTACASGLVEVLAAYTAIRSGQCDIALVGSGEAIDPLFAAGFRKMRVLADDENPQRACRPFDRRRSGFVMGEGAAMFVVERLGHALRRGARIYAEIASCRSLAEAHHVTGLDASSESLSHLIACTLADAGIGVDEVGYVNAHGTGTQQNDLFELRAIQQAFGPAAGNVCVSATKSMLGHLINAAGSVELAITVLAMRDGFAPPTINLSEPDPACQLDCVPGVGRPRRFQHALKLSVGFGGHLVAVALRRWNNAASGFAYPSQAKAA